MLRTRDSRVFWLIVLAALGIRLAWVLAVRPVPVSDFAWYYDRALGLVHGQGYSVNGIPTAFWPPGWPYVLAAIVRTFGPSVLAAEIAQACFNALTAGFAFTIARALFGWKSAIAAGCAYALLPSAVEWNAALASEPLYTLLWAAATAIWVTRSTGRTGWFALSGILLGAAALVRPSALLFWIVLLAYVLLVPKERRRLRQGLTAAAVTAACTLLVVAPVIVRNYRVFGTLVVVSNNGGVSLYEGNNPQSGPGYTELDNPRIARLIANPRTEAQGDHLASRLALQYIVTHPMRELTLSLRKIKALYQSDDSVVRFTLRSRHFREVRSPPAHDRVASAAVAVNNAAYYTIMAFALYGLGLCFLARRQRDPRWLLLLGLILYNTAIFALIGGLDRYRYPVMPYFSAFAGYGFAALALVFRRLRPAGMQISGHIPQTYTQQRSRRQ